MNVKQDQSLRKGRKGIERELRRRIVEGEYGVGERLPRRLELEEEFGASSVTVQRAMDELVEEGFVEVRGRQATVVSEYPPHLYRVGLIFRRRPGEAGWSRFSQALSNEAVRLNGEGRRKVEVYYGVDPNPRNEGYRALVEGVEKHLFAGLIFGSNPLGSFVDTPLFEGVLPRVALMSGESERVATVRFDEGSFLEKAFGALAGCKRLAVLMNPRDARYEAEVLWRAGEAGMEVRPYWVQRVSLEAPEVARGCVHLLMHEGQVERPDGLLVTNDNLVEYALAGLMDAGVRVPQELRVVGHCNFPCVSGSVMPVRRLGFDAREVLRECVERVEGLRKGERISGRLMEAHFEEEFVFSQEGNENE